MKTKEEFEEFAKERIQKKLEEEVKGMTWNQRAFYLSRVASVYLEELSNHYDDVFIETQHIRDYYYTQKDGD